MPRSRRLKRVILAGFVLSAVVASLGRRVGDASSGTPNEPPIGQFRFRSATDVVALSVSVAYQNEPVRGLRQGEFEVFEDDVA